MWLSECQPLNRNRIWHACTQLKKCELPHGVFDLNVTCHQEKAWSNISRAIIKCYKQLVFIHWHSLSSPFHFKCLVIEIHWMRETLQAGQHWSSFVSQPAAPIKRLRHGAPCKDPRPSPASSAVFPTPAHWELKAVSTSHIQGLSSCPQTWTKEKKKTKNVFLGQSFTCLNQHSLPLTLQEPD